MQLEKRQSFAYSRVMSTLRQCSKDSTKVVDANEALALK